MVSPAPTALGKAGSQLWSCHRHPKATLLTGAFWWALPGVAALNSRSWRVNLATWQTRPLAGGVWLKPPPCHLRGAGCACDAHAVARPSERCGQSRGLAPSVASNVAGGMDRQTGNVLAPLPANSSPRAEVVLTACMQQAGTQAGLKSLSKLIQLCPERE